MVSLQQKIIEGTKEGIILLDKELKVKFVNPAAVVLLGYSQERCKDMYLPKLLAEKDADWIEYEDKLKEAVKKGTDFNPMFTQMVFEYRDKLLKIELDNIIFENVSYSVLYLIDVTQLMGLEKDLEKALSVEEKIELQTADIRKTIITFLFSSIIVFTIGGVAINFFSKDQKHPEIYTIISGLTGSLGTIMGYYFKEEQQKNNNSVDNYSQYYQQKPFKQQSYSNFDRNWNDLDTKI